MTHNESPYNCVIYYYTSVEEALKIIYSKTFKFSSISLLPHLKRESFQKEEEFIDVKRNFRISLFFESFKKQDLWAKYGGNNQGVLIGFRFANEMFKNTSFSLHKAKYTDVPKLNYNKDSRHNVILDFITSIPQKLAEEQALCLINETPDRPLFLRDSLHSIIFGSDTPPLQKAQLYAIAKSKGINSFTQLNRLRYNNQFEDIPYKGLEQNKADDDILSKEELHLLLIDAGYKAYLYGDNNVRFKSSHGSRTSIIISPEGIKISSPTNQYYTESELNFQQAKMIIEYSKGGNAASKLKKFQKGEFSFDGSTWR